MKILKKNYIKKKCKNSDSTEIMALPDFLFTVSELKDKFFEISLSQKGIKTYTKDCPLNAICIEAINNFQVTINFGTVGHIHLTVEEFQELRKGLNWLNNKFK
jgi:hypothetical protein